MRERLLTLLWDLDWHEHPQLRAVAGTRYSARLLELKRLGYQIEDEHMRGEQGKRYRLLTRDRGDCLGKLVKVYLREADVVRMLKGEITVYANSRLAKALQSFRDNKHKL